MKVLRHPYLIHLHEIYEDQKQIYFVIEDVENGELFDLIVKNRKLPENEACRIYFQLAEALEYIHLIKIVHRDLKPENVLLDKNFNIKLIDFGLSNIYTSNENLQTACGSPCYAAPEMILGEKYSAYKVDIWSSGVVLYTMLTGHLPFDAPQIQKLYSKIISGTYVIPEYLSPLAKNFI